MHLTASSISPCSVPGSYELFIEAVDENYNYMQKRYPFKVAATDVYPDGRHADYAEGIQWVIDEGISNGTSAAKFLPDEQCTRAQVVTFIWRAAGRRRRRAKPAPFMMFPTAAIAQRPCSGLSSRA